MNTCNYCGVKITFEDSGMGNYKPRDPEGKVHICNKNPYLKKIKGRQTYSCFNCKSLISKGALHYLKKDWVLSNPRIHLSC